MVREVGECCWLLEVDVGAMGGDICISPLPIGLLGWALSDELTAA